MNRRRDKIQATKIWVGYLGSWSVLQAIGIRIYPEIQRVVLLEFDSQTRGRRRTKKGAVGGACSLGQQWALCRSLCDPAQHATIFRPASPGRI